MPSLGQALLQAKDFIVHLATINGDLSNITAPPSLLSTKSTTEFPATWASHHGLFLAQGASDDPLERALAVLTNFLCSLKGQTYTGRGKEEGLKKPLNAFLGEVFVGVFEGEEGSTKLWCEQVRLYTAVCDGLLEVAPRVLGKEKEEGADWSIWADISCTSHHPPVTACALFNVLKGISAEGYIAQETTFSLSHGLRVSQIGHAVIRIHAYSESHLLTLPTLCLKNMLSGNPYPELSGTSHIVSSSGYTSRVDFSGKKSVFSLSSSSSSSQRNTLHATLYATADTSQTPLFEITGQWNNTLTVTDARTGATRATLVVDEIPTTEMSLPPVAEQDPWESRRAWDEVVQAIEKGDMAGTAKAKAVIEGAQREMRKVEAEHGVEWPRMFFLRGDGGERSERTRAGGTAEGNGNGKAEEHGEAEDDYTSLAATISHPLQADKTAGVWRFVGFEAAQGIEWPLHRGLAPTGQVGGGGGGGGGG